MLCSTDERLARADVSAFRDRLGRVTRDYCLARDYGSPVFYYISARVLTTVPGDLSRGYKYRTPPDFDPLIAGRRCPLLRDAAASFLSGRWTVPATRVSLG